MDDYEAIRNLYAEYCYLMDDRDDALAMLFTEDCWLASGANNGAGRRGRAGILGLLEDTRADAAREPDDVRHIVVNLHIDIDIDGDTATTKAYVLSFRQGPERPYLRHIGRYEGELVREDRWRLKVHRLVPQRPAWFGAVKAG